MKARNFVTPPHSMNFYSFSSSVSPTRHTHPLTLQGQYPIKAHNFGFDLSDRYRAQLGVTALPF